MKELPEPSEQYRRKLDYSSPTLWTPGMRPMRQQGQDLMSVECPKCKVAFSAPRKFSFVICKADKPPFTGDNLGCGWMLGLDPPHNTGKRGKAFAVIDLKLDPGTGRFQAKLFKEGFRRIVQDWERRGLCRAVTNEEGMIVAIHPIRPTEPSEN